MLMSLAKYVNIALTLVEKSDTGLPPPPPHWIRPWPDPYYMYTVFRHIKQNASENDLIVKCDNLIKTYDFIYKYSYVSSFEA